VYFLGDEMTEKKEYWDITDDDGLWAQLYFPKIPNANPLREMGNRLEVATEIGLIKAGIEYEDTTRVSQRGHVPDFRTETMTIECKNTLGAINGENYKIDANKYIYEILSRFETAGDTYKMLIMPEGTAWNWHPLYMARQEGIIIIYVTPVRFDTDVIPAANQIAAALSSYVV